MRYNIKLLSFLRKSALLGPKDKYKIGRPTWRTRWVRASVPVILPIADVQCLPRARRQKGPYLLFFLVEELTTASETRYLAMRNTSAKHEGAPDAARRARRVSS